MNDLALPVAVSDSAFRQDSNLKIAQREGMFLNAFVELPCSQTSRPMLPASAGGPKP
jgi:hypothetical protein